MLSNAMQLAKPTFSLMPSSFDEAEKFAKLIADSDFAPKDYRGRPGNVLVAVQMGAELGLAPMQALQNIAVINGRPSVFGDAALAIIKAHPDFVDCIETGDESIATCTIKRRGRTDVTRTFSREDAQRAKLWDKDVWKAYPKRMLQMRARGFAIRDQFPDALRGLITAEEAQDIPRDARPVSLVKETTLPSPEIRGSRTEAIKQDLKQRLEPALPSDISELAEEFLARIASSQNGDELGTIAVDIQAANLGDADKLVLKNAWKERGNFLASAASTT